MRYRSP